MVQLQRITSISAGKSLSFILPEIITFSAGHPFLPSSALRFCRAAALWHCYPLALGILKRCSASAVLIPTRLEHRCAAGCHIVPARL